MTLFKSEIFDRSIRNLASTEMLLKNLSIPLISKIIVSLKTMQIDAVGGY